MVRGVGVLLAGLLLLASSGARADAPMSHQTPSDQSESDLPSPDRGQADKSQADKSQVDKSQADQAPKAETGPGEIVKGIIVSAPRDMGFFQGDLVEATADIVVTDGYTIDAASLPRPGPVTYWLDVRKIDVASRKRGDDRRFRLRILYQDFYDALDAREQEIPGFAVTFTKDGRTVIANVPSWSIGVSPLREISPAPKSDPKDYLRPDAAVPFVAADPYWLGAGWALLAALASLGLLARDRAWWPFQARPARVFAGALRRLRVLGRTPIDESRYLEGLRALHRGIDATAGRRVLAEDLPGFLERHPLFVPLRDGLAAFFAASRRAFFGSDPRAARAELDFADLVGLTRRLAAIERAEP